MHETYQVIPSSPLEKGATFHKPTQWLPERVTYESPALDVMTDLKIMSTVTIEPLALINWAQQKMLQYGVKLLFVTDEKNAIVGLITTTDILGEKPMQFIQSHGGSHSEILVRDIMTPREQLEVLCMDDVLHATVGHVIATLKSRGRQHALVVDKSGSDGRQIVRGIFSTTQLNKQLKMVLQTTEIARTFAEIEAELAK